MFKTLTVLLGVLLLAPLSVKAETGISPRDLTRLPDPEVERRLEQQFGDFLHWQRVDPRDGPPGVFPSLVLTSRPRSSAQGVCEADFVELEFDTRGDASSLLDRPEPLTGIRSARRYHVLPTYRSSPTAPQIAQWKLECEQLNPVTDWFFLADSGHEAFIGYDLFMTATGKVRQGASRFPIVCTDLDGAQAKTGTCTDAFLDAPEYPFAAIARCVPPPRLRDDDCFVYRSSHSKTIYGEQLTGTIHRIEVGPYQVVGPLD